MLCVCVSERAHYIKHLENKNSNPPTPLEKKALNTFKPLLLLPNFYGTQKPLLDGIHPRKLSILVVSGQKPCARKSSYGNTRKQPSKASNFTKYEILRMTIYQCFINSCEI